MLWVCQGGWGSQKQALLVRWLKTRASPPAIVYQKVEQVPSPAADFELPNGCALAVDNCWVIMAQIIPWSEFEAEYAQNFVTEMGSRLNHFGWRWGH